MTNARLPEVGDAAIDFALESSAGPIQLADFAGKPLVLYFYPKDNTSGCTREALDFTALADEFAALDTAVVGVSPDSLRRHANFIEKHGLRLCLAADPEHELIGAYGCWVKKKLYGREYMGVERSTFLIDGKGRIAALWRKVKVAGHADAVLTAVKALSDQ